MNGYTESEAKVQSRWEARKQRDDKIIAEKIEVAPWDEIPDIVTVTLPPARINTLQQWADARELSFNKHYYGNNGLPYFPHQKG